MAATPVRVMYGFAGITGAVLKLFALGSSGTGDPANGGSGDTLTALTNRPIVYEATVTEALSGRYEAYMYSSGGVVLYTGVVDLADTTDVCTVGEYAVADVAMSQTDYDAISEAVWGVSARTLTQTAAQVADVMEGSDITIHRGDTTTISLTGLGNIAARTKLWFTAKAKRTDDDTDAILLATEADGLATIMGRAPVAGEACTITVSDEVTGALTILLSAAATQALTNRTGSVYDLQMLTASGVTTLTEAQFAVSADVTQAIA